jgi:hypothetical protein
MGNVKFDISGWDYYNMSYGSCKCWDEVPENVKKRALEMMKELQEMSYGISVNIEIWPLSEESKKFARDCHNATKYDGF